jgi:hypothetical protein
MLRKKNSKRNGSFSVKRECVCVVSLLYAVARPVYLCVLSLDLYPSNSAKDSEQSYLEKLKRMRAEEKLKSDEYKQVGCVPFFSSETTAVRVSDLCLRYFEPVCCTRCLVHSTLWHACDRSWNRRRWKCHHGGRCQQTEGRDCNCARKPAGGKRSAKGCWVKNTSRWNRFVTICPPRENLWSDPRLLRPISPQN